MSKVDLRRLGLVRSVELVGFSAAAEVFGVTPEEVIAAWEMETGDIVPKARLRDEEVVAGVREMWRLAKEGGATPTEFLAAAGAMMRLPPKDAEELWLAAEDYSHADHEEDRKASRLLDDIGRPTLAGKRRRQVKARRRQALQADESR